MGQSKGSGYSPVQNFTPEQIEAFNKALQQGGSNLNRSASAYADFLKPGGENPIAKQANQNFQQNTIPSLLSAFGTNVKGSSDLNQALASGAANLNTDIAAKLAPLYLDAANGLGSIGARQSALGAQQQFSHLQNQPSLFMQLFGPLLGLGGDLGGSAIRRF